MTTTSGPGWSLDLDLVDGDVDDNGHVGNVAVARLLHVARSSWLVTLDGRPPGHVYVVRHLSISYEREGLPGQTFRCEVHCTDLGRRSLTLAQTLRADGEVMAVASAVHVAFDTGHRRAVELWPAVIDAIERRQAGRPPMTARP